jgi:predicted HD phosphohydrolase
MSYTRLDQTTPQDWAVIRAADKVHLDVFPDFLRRSLLTLDGYEGFPISRLQHCLQTATRAHRDGAPEEKVAVALLHDIGDVFSPANHAEVAAAILRPYVSDTSYRILRHHTAFQLRYYGNQVGADPNAREKFRGQPWFDEAAAFCERWDNPSFDPGYPSLPLSFFEPLIVRLFSSPKA